MAWTSPRTWSACEVVTAAIMNTHVRDNLNQTFPSLVTTKGDMIAATAANAGQRIPVGAYGQVLVANSACTAGVGWNATGLNIGTATTACPGDVALQNSLLITGNASVPTDTGFRIFNQTGIGPTINGNTFQVHTGTPTTSLAFTINNSGQVYVGASGTNAFMNTGINIVSSCNNEFISLKGSTLKHGMTSLTETDTGAQIHTGGPNTGGLSMQGFTPSSVGGINAIGMSGFSGSPADTTKSNAANAIIYLSSFVQSGTSFTSTASIGNILGIANAGCTRFIFQGGGDLYADSSLTASAFDSHDDVQMIRALEVERAPGSVIRDQFDAWLKYNRRDLEAANIATFNDPAEGGDGSVFVNVTGLQRLHSGAIWQLHKRNAQLEEKLAQLESRLARLLPSVPPEEFAT